jgi:transposase
MKHYAGLDVSLKETSICIVDETGSICREMKTPSHPEDLARVLQDPTWQLARIGLEAGPLSQWLFSGLAEAGLPVVCIETRHTKAFLKAQVNKSDRNDARGIAQMMRVNLFRRVHVKTATSQQRRALLTARRMLQYLRTGSPQGILLPKSSLIRRFTTQWLGVELGWLI